MTLDEQARDVLRKNDKGGYTLPTHGLYPYQWNWDSAFAAWGFTTFDSDRGWTELETLMSGQWEDGMLPHILFHRVDPGYFPGPDVWQGRGPIPSSGISQPPVAATFMAPAVATYRFVVGAQDDDGDGNSVSDGATNKVDPVFMYAVVKAIEVSWAVWWLGAW